MRLSFREAGNPVESAVAQSLQGYLDKVEHDLILGWAHDPDQPDRPVEVEIWVDGEKLIQLTADAYRPDLESVGIGDGLRGFSFSPGVSLSLEYRHVVEARRAADGAQLPGSPKVLEAQVDHIAKAPPVVLPSETRLRLPGVLSGYLDLVRRDLITGWAHDPSRLDEPVSLLVTVNGQLLERVLSNRYRADLEQAGFGDGRKSFQLSLTPALSPLLRQLIEVRREEDGEHLPGSPRVLAPETDFTADAKAWMTQVFAGLVSDASLDDGVHYLTSELELLLQRRADEHSQRFERHFQRQPRFGRIGEEGQARDSQVRESAPEKLRALFIDERPPDGGQDAGSNAILSHMRCLQRLGFEISFASAEMKLNSGAGLAAEGFDHCGPPWYASVEEVLMRQAHCFDLVYLHRLSIADRYIALVRQHQPKAKLIYSIADLHFLRVQRQARVEQRPELVSLANRMQVAELLAISRVDQVITHSTHEAELLRRQVPRAKVHVVPWSMPAQPTTVPLLERRGIAFIGGYGHAPNVDAALWLIDDIMPLLRERDPEFECLLVGSDLPAVLKAPRPGVVPVGQVETLASIFDRVRVTVAPMTYGAGIKGKVLDSLAAGVPCVCTPIAAEGLDLPQELLSQMADDPRAIADAIMRLHEDSNLNQAASDAGLGYIRQRMSEPQIDLLMRNVVGLAAVSATAIDGSNTSD